MLPAGRDVGPRRTRRLLCGRAAGVGGGHLQRRRRVCLPAVLGARAAGVAAALRRAVLPRAGHADHDAARRAGAVRPRPPRSPAGQPDRPGARPPGDHLAGDAGHPLAAVSDALVHRRPAQRMGRRAHPNPVGGAGFRLLLRPPAGGPGTAPLPAVDLAADHRGGGARRRAAGAGHLAGVADRCVVLRWAAPGLGSRPAAGPNHRRRCAVDPRGSGRVFFRPRVPSR